MKTKSLAQIFTGLLVIGLGVGLFLNSLEIIDFGSTIKQWWPVIPIGIGIIGLMSSPRQWVWPLLLVGFGVAALLKQLGYVDFNLWSLFWPTILIVVGFSIIFQNTAWGSRPKVADDDHTDVTVIFAGQNVRNVSQHYRGGAISAIFGGVDLDLRDAKIESEATLTVVAAFGGADIKVPEGWVVRVKGMPVFGGWEDKTRKPTDQKNAPHLTITATCMFGGFSVGHKNNG